MSKTSEHTVLPGLTSTFHLVGFLLFLARHRHVLNITIFVFLIDLEAEEASGNVTLRDVMPMLRCINAIAREEAIDRALPLPIAEPKKKLFGKPDSSAWESVSESDTEAEEEADIEEIQVQTHAPRRMSQRKKKPPRSDSFIPSDVVRFVCAVIE